MDIREQIEQAKDHKELLERTRDSYNEAIESVDRIVKYLQNKQLDMLTGKNPLVILQLDVGGFFTASTPMRYKEACRKAEQHMQDNKVAQITPVEGKQGYEHRYESIPGGAGGSFWGAMIDLVPLEDYPDNFEWES